METKAKKTAMEALIGWAAAGARGDQTPPGEPDWNKLIPLAHEHSVLALVACAVTGSENLNYPEQAKEYFLNVMRTTASVNMVRRQRIMHLLGEMEKAGIAVKVLKGYAVASLYAHPECRESVDADLLISPKQEKLACELFEKHGFRVHARPSTSHHVVCQHARYGMIELHVKPYADLVDDAWFCGVGEEELLQEAPVTIHTAEGAISALGSTDHLIFLTLHLIKHFVLGGLTIRMMLDIALLFQKNKDSINAQRYWQLMKRLRYCAFVNGVLKIMIDCAGFCKADFPGMETPSPEQPALLLNDLEQGGYMGAKQKKERYESGMAFNRQVLLKNKSEKQYRLYMLQWKIKSGVKFMFPTGKQLKKMYPFLEKFPPAIPFVWLYNAVAYPIQKICKGVFKRDIQSSEKTASDAVQKRLEMFRKLEML